MQKNMESENVEERDIGEKQEAPTPICIRCMKPIDPLHYYCPYCGEASGQLTPYLPFVNIRWQATIWGRIWRQVWSRDVSIPGCLFRFIMVIWNVPIMLIGLIFRANKKTRDN